MKSLFRKGFDWLDMGVRTAVMAFATVMLLARSMTVANAITAVRTPMSSQSKPLRKSDFMVYLELF